MLQYHTRHQHNSISSSSSGHPHSTSRRASSARTAAGHLHHAGFPSGPPSAILAHRASVSIGVTCRKPSRQHSPVRLTSTSVDLSAAGTAAVTRELVSYLLSPGLLPPFSISVFLLTMQYTIRISKLQTGGMFN